MSEKPILFSAAMVRTLLDGRKTQTRRIFKLPSWAERYVSGAMQGEKTGDIEPKDPRDRGWYHIEEMPCPHGAIGDRLWVRESGIIINLLADKGHLFRHDVPTTPTYGDYWVESTRAVGASFNVAGCSRASALLSSGGAKVCPSIQMPRWACRFELEITNARIERLQDISEADAIAESVNAGS